MVILIRHAEAGDADRDELRPLTARGRADAVRLGTFLERSGQLHSAAVWHSTLVRARETAELVMAQGRGSKEGGLREVSGFAPDDSPIEVVGRLAGHEGDLAVFGHNPHLTALATLLIKGEEARVPVVAFEKCSALALGKLGAGRPGEWYVCWLLPPELLPARA